ncbi:MAG: nuclear transport factor 2 family protein [Syntrophaceae bacterium]
MLRLTDGAGIDRAKGSPFGLRVLTSVILVLFFLICSSINASGFMNSKYAPEIKAAVQKFSALYKRMDADGIASIYSSDRDIVIIGAGKDQENIESVGAASAYRKEFSFYKKINSLEIKINYMSSLGHICWISADVFGNVILLNEAKSIVSGRFTAVLRKFGNKWLFIQTHFSIPADGPKILK